MKAFFFIIGLAVATMLGYMFEPSIRPALVAKPSEPASTSTTKEPADRVFVAEIDFSSIAPEQLPGEVTLTKDLSLADQASGITISIQSGATAGLIRIEGNQAVIRPANTAYNITVPITHTDLAKRLLVRPATPAPIPAPAPTPATPEPPPTVAPVTPEPAPAPQPVATNPEPPATGSQPEPVAPPATPATTPVTPAGDVVAIMRKSLENEEISSFTIQDVKSWQPEPDETIDGTTFQVGSITYEQKSVFGLNIIAAKAYIRDGKVERWVWPKSGLVIQ